LICAKLIRFGMLVPKNLVKKFRTLENENEVLLSLTSLGLTIYTEKEAHFQKLSKNITMELQSLTPDQRGALFNILNLVEDHIDEHLNKADEAWK
jgi:DNA-binding MarR family transcriptional regulator